MVDIKINIYQKIEIIENNVTFKSNIQDVRSDYILIDMPIAGNRYYTMHTGSNIKFFITSENEIFKCQSTVLGKTKDNNVTLIVLSYPTVISRVQRREFFRLPVNLNINYYVLKDYEANYSLRAIFNTNIFSKLQQTYTVDLSGGGAKIIIRDKCTKGSKILIEMDLPEKIIAIASVVRGDIVEDEQAYRTAIKFETINEIDRDKIIAFVFAKHREHTKLLKRD